jgi:hypothetical protein
MKNPFVIIVLLFITSVSFAQRGNWNWGNDNVQTISGTITDNQRPCAFLKGNDGNTYQIHMGPVWYWNQNNYSLSLSDATIKGNVKTFDGTYNIYPFTIEQGTNKMTFTDNNGIPKWNNGKEYGWGKNSKGKGNCCCRCNNK